jgi:DNA-binding response OmpR family regulator
MSGVRHASKPPPILVVEHDREIGAALLEQLAADGYRVRLACTAEHARSLACALAPGLLLLGDLDTGTAAIELLTEIRSGAWCQGRRAGSPWPDRLPAIVIGSKAQESDLLRAFEAGADDFLARPASYLELRARLRALLARTAGDSTSAVLRVGTLAIDTAARIVSLRGRRVTLRRLEYELLLTLASDPERVFAKHELMQLVWGYHVPASTRTLDSHASRLRRRLAIDDSGGWIVNVRGIGYRLT